MNNISPVKSKYSNCPACRIELTIHSSYAEPNIRAISVRENGQTLPKIIGFQFKCRRCSYEWTEHTEAIKKPPVTQPNPTYSNNKKPELPPNNLMSEGAIKMTTTPVNKIANEVDGGLHGYFGQKLKQYFNKIK